MVTVCRIGTSVNNDLRSFLSKNNCSAIQFELLRYIGQHPKAKLSFSVIADAMGTTDVDTCDALTGLIECNFVSTECNENGLVTYCFSNGWEIGIYIDEIAFMDRSKASVLKKHLK